MLRQFKMQQQARQLAKSGIVPQPIQSVWHQKTTLENRLGILCSAEAANALLSKSPALMAKSHANLFWIESDDKQWFADLVREVAEEKAETNSSFALPAGWAEELFFAQDLVDDKKRGGFKLTT